MNALDFYAQHAREHQGSIDAKTGDVAKKLAEDWAALKNRLTAYLNLKAKPYAPDAWALECIDNLNADVLLLMETPKVEVENCNIDD